VFQQQRIGQCPGGCADTCRSWRLQLGVIHAGAITPCWPCAAHMTCCLASPIQLPAGQHLVGRLEEIPHSVTHLVYVSWMSSALAGHLHSRRSWPHAPAPGRAHPPKPPSGSCPAWTRPRTPVEEEQDKRKGRVRAQTINRGHEHLCRGSGNQHNNRLAPSSRNPTLCSVMRSTTMVWVKVMPGSAANTWAQH
jgi:hypothetical protein